MVREKIHASNADRQREYRRRKAAMAEYVKQASGELVSMLNEVQPGSTMDSVYHRMITIMYSEPVKVPLEVALLAALRDVLKVTYYSKYMTTDEIMEVVNSRVHQGACDKFELKYGSSMKAVVRRSLDTRKGK